MPRALVTGASSGLGRCLALDLAKNGFDLILVARREAELRRLADEIGQLYSKSKIEVVAHDLTDDAFAAGLAVAYPDVDVLINNAGFGAAGELHQTDWPTYQRMIDLNVSALCALTYTFARSMKKRGTGTIMNVGSLAGFGPTPNFAVYGATKSFVLMFSNAIDFELRGSGVRVLCACPGGMDTAFNDVASMSEKTRSMRMTPAAVSREIVTAIARGKERTVPGAMYKIFAALYIHAPLLTRKFVAPLFAR
jgi:short-subunit dehydrogenase